jgi:hypothetical protein
MKHFTSDIVAQVAHPPLEWKPDLDRLRAEIDAARRTGRTDDLAIAEAECWIDLIDSELSARRNRIADPELAKLRRWKAELTAMLRDQTEICDNEH